MKPIRWLDDHFEEFVLVVFLVLISVVMMLQVIVRKMPGIPALTWAEEFCRFMWIGSVFFSLPYTIRKGNMLRVNVLLDLLPHALRKTVNLAIDLITAGCMALLFWYTHVKVLPDIVASGETSPAMGWAMSGIYAMMEAGFFLGIVRGLQMFVIHLRRFGERELSAIEQTMADAEEEAAAGKKAEQAPRAEGGN
ncbi:MAG: TRAP transporter small permease [Synergistaceae bacterium]|nr:TRAP transporter small permease [Synergistaceae bacterium]